MLSLALAVWLCGFPRGFPLRREFPGDFPNRRPRTGTVGGLWAAAVETGKDVFEPFVGVSSAQWSQSTCFVIPRLGS